MDKKEKTNRDPVAIVALVLSLFLAFVNIFGQRANLVLPHNDIDITWSDQTENINFALRNIGNRAASNVNLNVYLTVSGSETINGELISHSFNERIINPIYPGTSSEVVTLSHSLLSKMGRDTRGVMYIFLVHLKYQDPILGLTDRFYLYHHIVGTPGIRPLTLIDYKKVGCKFLTYFSKSSDSSVKQFLLSLSPQKEINCDTGA